MGPRPRSSTARKTGEDPSGPHHVHRPGSEACPVGDHIFIGVGLREPQNLVRALARNEDVVEGEILHIPTLGVAPHADPRFPDASATTLCFIGANVRGRPSRGLMDYPPSDPAESRAVPQRTSRRRRADHGVPAGPRGLWRALGISVDVVKSAIGRSTWCSPR